MRSIKEVITRGRLIGFFKLTFSISIFLILTLDNLIYDLATSNLIPQSKIFQNLYNSFKHIIGHS